MIDQLRRRFGQIGKTVVQGIGDDAAILSPTPNTHLLVSTDLLIERIHFDLKFESLRDVGYRAAVANLSDIAAMGGSPQYLLVAIALSSAFSESALRAFYKGLMIPCQKYGVELIGGDTSASPSSLCISITIIGKVESGKAIYRQGAQIGDLIYVTGTLGDSRAGLQLLQRNQRTVKNHRRSRTRSFLINRHLRPAPRVKIGRLLSQHRLATAAIDLSDGLSSDLRHVCRASHVGAEIDAMKLPFSRPFRTYVQRRLLDPIDFALQGGEDYELLFTVSPQKLSRLNQILRNREEPVTCIGVITAPAKGVRLKRQNGSVRKLPPSGYEHFLV